ncbi:tyrosine-type recombinase/integrase [Microcoleus sp. B4-D4]|uniref:tyrosine-type recombinase/integrase n=1 Tax=Microcoleus sp. B4-D4 TaxID=2818667 RepID=UPI002FCF33A9
MRADKHPQLDCDIKVATDGNSIRLSFPKRHTPLWETLDGKSLKGKPKYLYLTKYGFKADNPADRKRAAQIAIAIESDLDHPEWDKLFDLTLAKYGLGGGKYAKIADVLQLPGTTQLEPEITVGECWERYLEWKVTTVEETTFKVMFNGFTNVIFGKKWDNNLKTYSQLETHLSTVKLSDKALIIEEFDKIKVCRKPYLMNELSRAFDFCKSKEAINATTENPFLAGKFSKPTVTTQDKYADKVVNGELISWHEVQDEKALEEDRRAFTKIERDTIIKAFYENENSTNRYLAPLIEFYFLTGCRTSEAVALNWGDIDFNRGTIRFSKSIGTCTNKIKETKTGEVRIFYFKNDSRLREILLEIKSASKSDLVFPSKKGKYIKYASLSNAWAGNSIKKMLADGTMKTYHFGAVVSQLVEDGKLETYLSLYHTRHTYITLTAHANKHNTDSLLYIATSCGNSVDVILRHYLCRTENPDLISV